MGGFVLKDLVLNKVLSSTAAQWLYQFLTTIASNAKTYLVSSGSDGRDALMLTGQGYYFDGSTNAGVDTRFKPTDRYKKRCFAFKCEIGPYNTKVFGNLYSYSVEIKTMNAVIYIRWGTSNYDVSIPFSDFGLDAGSTVSVGLRQFIDGGKYGLGGYDVFINGQLIPPVDEGGVLTVDYSGNIFGHTETYVFGGVSLSSDDIDNDGILDQCSNTYFGIGKDFVYVEDDVWTDDNFMVHHQNANRFVYKDHAGNWASDTLSPSQLLHYISPGNGLYIPLCENNNIGAWATEMISGDLLPIFGHVDANRINASQLDFGMQRGLFNVDANGVPINSKSLLIESNTLPANGNGLTITENDSKLEVRDVD